MINLKKILLVGTGGTIGSKKDDSIALHAPFKILDYYDNNDNVVFETQSPFTILSEHMNLDYWQQLIDYLNKIDFDSLRGVILLHGSDTLAFTGALLSHLFYDKRIVLVGSNKPPEDELSNAANNFKEAVSHILNSNELGVFISYDGLIEAYAATSADCRDRFVKADVAFSPTKKQHFVKKNILIIYPYPGISYENFELKNVDAVLHAMYHSATVTKDTTMFCDKCKERNIDFYYVTTKKQAEYETAKNLSPILLGSTMENAYAKILLEKTK